MKPSVLVTKRLYPSAINYLRERVDLDYHESDDLFPAEALLERLNDKQGVVSQLTDKFTPEVMSALPGLKVISNVAVGFDNIEPAAATEHGIGVTNTPDVLTDTTADFAFTLLMAAARRLVEADKLLRAGEWNQWRIDLLCRYPSRNARRRRHGTHRQIGRAARARFRNARSLQRRTTSFTPA